MAEILHKVAGADLKLFKHYLGIDPEGVVWKSSKPVISLDSQPYCNKHKLPLQYVHDYVSDDEYVLSCPEDSEEFQFKRGLYSHRKFIIMKMEAAGFKDMKVQYIDAEGNNVLAKERDELKGKSGKGGYWVEAKLTDTAKGIQLMVQAGKKDNNKKSQLFIDTPAQRLSFDKSEKDNHPSGMFTKVSAEFKDSTTEITHKN